MTEPVLTIMDRLLNLFNCANDKELLAELNKAAKFHQPQLSRWRNKGFHKSTENLLSILLDRIENLESELYSYLLSAQD